jgi:hypothetical protein
VHATFTTTTGPVSPNSSRNQVIFEGHAFEP